MSHVYFIDVSRSAVVLRLLDIYTNIAYKSTTALRNECKTECKHVDFMLMRQEISTKNKYFTRYRVLIPTDLKHGTRWIVVVQL